MNSKKTPLKDCFVLQPSVFEDKRGEFIETYNAGAFK
ncbi:MAG: dTDP-4-dehydrorhamnose 3,5-epimerase family protein, partial [Marinirhabdus sp.]